MAVLIALAIWSAAGSAAPPGGGEMRGVHRWLGERGGVLSSALEVRPSAGCGGGLGLFATRKLEPLETLGEVPLAACVTAQCALDDPLIGSTVRAYLAEHAEDPGAESIALAVFLAHARARLRARDGGAADDASGCAPFVDSLPWGDGGDGSEDSLAAHPLISRDLTGLERHEDALSGHLESALASCAAVSSLLKAAGAACADDEALCFRAVMIVASRSFNLAAPLRQAGLASLDADGLVGGRYVMVPWFDCLNHPSVGALAAGGEAGKRFKQHKVTEATARWRMRAPVGAEGSLPVVTIHAPAELAVEAGDELWQWYGNAGWGSTSREDWEDGEAKFLAQEYKDALTEWIASGGSYVGICMGGYLAGDEEGAFKLISVAREMPTYDPPLAIHSVRASLYSCANDGMTDVDYTAQASADVKNMDQTFINVLWRGRPKTIYFQGGPSFKFKTGLSAAKVAKVDVVAKYGNGQIAAAIVPYGAGAVGVMGPHPEASASWCADAAEASGKPKAAPVESLFRAFVAETIEASDGAGQHDDDDDDE